MLVLGELSCWTIFGVHAADPRLATLGFTGVAASSLMLARIYRTSRVQRGPGPPRAARRRALEPVRAIVVDPTAGRSERDAVPGVRRTR
jgi:hypothetical protein